MSSGYFGNFRYGVSRFSSENSDSFVPAAIPDDLNSDVVLVFYDHITGDKTLIVSDGMQSNSISDIQFELVNTGCGAFSFTLAAKSSVEIKLKNWVEIYLYKSATPWFVGTIETRPHPKSTSTVTQKYAGHGFFYQLNTCIVDKTYPAGMALDMIVRDIVQNFIVPKTSIKFLSWQISPIDTTITGDLQFIKTAAKDALQTIADIAQNFVFGVDENRCFFFQPVSFDLNTNAVKFVSKHMLSFPVVEDPSMLANRIYVMGGASVDGSNFLVRVDDASSQSQYGIFEAVMTAPAILSVSDATVWGNYQLSKFSKPLQKATLQTVTFDEVLIKPVGKARIWTENPSPTDYIDLFVVKATYKISGSGIILDMEVGEIDQVSEDLFLGVLRDIQNQALLTQANLTGATA